MEQRIMKKVGIVIPIYNSGKYLRECLDSVINQTYKNFEVVLVNDGSTDEISFNIAKEYVLKDERFILFDKKNGGQSSSRNVGIEYFEGKYKLKNKSNFVDEKAPVEFDIEGENQYGISNVYKRFNNNREVGDFSHSNIDYIIFLDSDDYWELDCLEECVAKMDGVEIVWFDYGFKHEIDEKHYAHKIAVRDSFLKIYGYKFSKKITKLEWLDRVDNSNSTFACVCGGLIDFSFLKKIELKFLDNVIHEDHHFGILLFLQANNIYVLLKELYNYRITTGTTCHYDEKIKSIPAYINGYYEIFGDMDLAKKYHMISSIFINALEIIKFIKAQEDLDFARKIERSFLDFLYFYHFALLEFDKDPLGLIEKLKNLKIIFEEHELQYPELDFFVKNGTGVQKIKTSLEYHTGSKVIKLFKRKRIFKALSFIFESSKKTQDKNFSKLPYEAYPDYEQILKVQQHLSYKIGHKIVLKRSVKYRSYIWLLMQLLGVFIKWSLRKKLKVKQHTSLRKMKEINREQYPIFRECDLIDVAYKKDILKNSFIDQKKGDKYWRCCIGYNVLLEGIKIKFDKEINKDDIKIYLHSYGGELLIESDLFFKDGDFGFYINISQSIIIRQVSIFVKDDVELLEFKIFKRKTLGYVVSAKPDAFGMRLAGIMVGMYLAKQINFKFAFVWENKIDVDFLNVRQSVKNDDIHYLGNAMEKADYIFDSDFLNNYLIDSKCTTPSWGHNLGFKKRTLKELKYGKSDEVWGWYSTDILPSKWIEGCDEKECLKDLSRIYHSIKFSSRFNKILNDLDLIFKRIDKEFIAIHIRGGEVIFSDSRKVPGWHVTQERYFPYEIALELALRELNKGNLVIIFGQDLKSNAILTDFMANKTNASMIKCVDDFIECDYTDMERSFFDMNFISRAKIIYSAKESVFSKVAMMISGKNNLISYHDVFSLQEQYDIIQKNLFCLNLHQLHTAMAYYRLYALSKMMGKSKEEIFNFLTKALECDQENDAYRIYIIDFYLQYKRYEDANQMLKIIFETRKEQFLKNFFENSCQSFNDEYKRYLSYRQNGYKYIDSMKEKVKKWIKTK
ncbi:glycosyltransferase family 2 protein [Campylobacter upsaliensis]|nr:glycosyltransferase family 2 protein [Campylobacter upsaliensis]